MSIQDQVDRLIDTRPGKELLAFAHDERALRIRDFIYRSSGTSASYLLVTNAGRVIVNTGMGWEAPHHKHLFDAICPGPTPYVITTQGHVDHVGGVARFREPVTRYVAQAMNRACQADDTRIARFRTGTALIWFGQLARMIGEFARRYPGAALGQDQPVPDLTFESRLGLRVGDLEIELHAAPGGETVDSCVVWLPQHRIALLSNLFGPLFPHFPNFNTLRGDKYRLAEPYLANVRRVRELAPELLITGRHLPIEGAELIDASLARLHGAVEYVHSETIARINAGQDVYTIMREVQLPPKLRVGQGYGKVSWAVRTIFESYTGWFQRRATSELYSDAPEVALADLVDLAGAKVVLDRARGRLAAGEALRALQLAEAVAAADPASREAAQLLVEAHEALLAAGGDANFWESGWLNHQISRWRAVADS
ncbi:MAG TPA: alkyl sulfatase dimerization domain-containing protein [Myxococcota bacterium]|nr:alkyl sulfatase dimerization domain-containing protein [Myxococcota bacterium]